MFVRALVLGSMLLGLGAKAFAFDAVNLILGSKSYGEMETNCLAANIYFEARSESLEAQWAVANVTLNRTADPRWPETICEVVFQDWQFSWVKTQSKKVREYPAWVKAVEVSETILNERKYIDLTSGATHYHADYISPPDWTHSLTKVVKLGKHIYYK